jgi:ubiquitin carboxyl-terminal hydrolase 22/27/51
MLKIDQQEKSKSGLEKIFLQVDKLSTPKCQECSNFTSQARLHCCLHCVYIGCKSHSAHYGKHTFCVDFNHLKVYCTKCKEYIYPLEFDRILDEEEYNVNFMITRIRDPNTQGYYGVARCTEKELEKISKHSTISKCSGIRGLRNMGATCFMNTILQALLNNPILQVHYLSGNHSACEVANCMSCQMVRLFQLVSHID